MYNDEINENDGRDNDGRDKVIKFPDQITFFDRKVEQVNNNGNSPLYIAAQDECAERADICALLRAHDAVVNEFTITNDTRNTPSPIAEQDRLADTGHTTQNIFTEPQSKNEIGDNNHMLLWSDHMLLWSAIASSKETLDVLALLMTHNNTAVKRPNNNRNTPQ